MVNLQNTPSAGMLTAADLDAARKHSTGNVWLMPRRATVAGRDTCNGQCETRAGCDCAPLLPHGCDGQGRHETRRFGQQAEFVDTVPTDFGSLHPAEACTELGHTDAAESMFRHRRTRATVGLAALLAVAGYLAHIAWPLLG